MRSIAIPRPAQTRITISMVTISGVCSSVAQVQRHRPDRVDRAVREIDEVGDAEYQRQANREQGVDVADDQALTV